MSHAMRCATAIVGLGRFVFCPEKYDTEAPSADKLTFSEVKEVLSGNRYIWIIALMGIVAAFSGGSGITAYYFTYIVGDVALMGAMAVIPLVILPSMLAFPWLMKKMPVSRIISLGALCGIIGGAVLLVAGASLPLIAVSSIVGGLAMLPITFLTQLLIIDNASYNEWLGKRRLESTMGATCVRVRVICLSALSNENHVPSTTTSLWAKLMNFRMPYTIVYPSATRAYRLPMATPSFSVWRN